jgi:hypothetical protein
LPHESTAISSNLAHTTPLSLKFTFLLSLFDCSNPI